MTLNIREELVFVLLGGVCFMIFCFVGIFKLLFWLFLFCCCLKEECPFGLEDNV